MSDKNVPKSAKDQIGKMVAQIGGMRMAFKELQKIYEATAKKSSIRHKELHRLNEAFRYMAMGKVLVDKLKSFITYVAKGLPEDNGNGHHDQAIIPGSDWKTGPQTEPDTVPRTEI